MRIKLSDHFTYGRLLRFTFPAIIMMIFTSFYVVVDGLFVANYVGKTALAAVNFVFPALVILSTFGYMFGTGGSALIAKTLGEGDRERANRLFSLFVYLCGGLGVVFALLGFLFLRPLMVALGAEGEMLEMTMLYGNILLLTMPFWNLQYAFQMLFVTAEKPKLGLYTTLLAGGANLLLDWLFVAMFRWGLAGAAIATAASQLVGGALPLIYFFCKNSSLLRLGATVLDWPATLRATSNGSSELVSGISGSLVNILYNARLLHYSGEDGVAAYSIMMYVAFIFIGMFTGFVNGAAPVIGFHYGAENHPELKNLRWKCINVCVAGSLAMLLLSQLLAVPFSRVFAGYDAQLYEMTLMGFRIYAVSFLFSGIAVFGSSFFTALNNGPVSAVISLLRTVVFQVGAVLLLPLLWGINGIWASIAVAEALSAVSVVVFIIIFRKRYDY